jgi:hypothetical protein
MEVGVADTAEKNLDLNIVVSRIAPRNSGGVSGESALAAEYTFALY